MELYQATKDFASSMHALVLKGDILELFETEDGVCYFQVIISSFALDFEISLTTKEVEKFLKKMVAS